MLRRTELEVNRLKEEIQRAKAGQIPIWPRHQARILTPSLQSLLSCGGVVTEAGVS